MLRTILIDVSTIPTAGQHYTLGGFAFSGREHPSVVDIQVSWDGLDGYDGYFKFCQKHVSALNWSDVTGLMTSFATPSGAENLINHDFSSNLVSLFIHKGTATTGMIKIRLSIIKKAF